MALFILSAPLPDGAPTLVWPLVAAAFAGGLLGWWLSRRQADKTSPGKSGGDLYRTLFEHAVEGVYENPVGGGFRSVNPAMARILGYNRVEDLQRLSVVDTE